MRIPRGVCSSCMLVLLLVLGVGCTSRRDHASPGTGGGDVGDAGPDAAQVADRDAQGGGSGQGADRDASGGGSEIDGSTTSADAATSAPDDAGDDAAISGTPITVTFQEGVDGYAGTKSVGISTYSGLGNPGEWNANGATFADGDNDWCTGVDIPSSPVYTEYWLLRFDDLNLPTGAKVVSATLTVNTFANDTDTTVFLSGRYLNVAWNGSTPASCVGCSSAPVGYRYRDGASNPWSALGASGEGTDLIASKSFRIPDSGFFPTGHNPFVLSGKLDPKVVQGWLEGKNHGVRLVTGVSGIHVSVVPPTRDANERPLSTRPLLTITYVE